MGLFDIFKKKKEETKEQPAPAPTPETTPSTPADNANAQTQVMPNNNVFSSVPSDFSTTTSFDSIPDSIIPKEAQQDAPIVEATPAETTPVEENIAPTNENIPVDLNPEFSSGMPTTVDAPSVEAVPPVEEVQPVDTPATEGIIDPLTVSNEFSDGTINNNFNNSPIINEEPVQNTETDNQSMNTMIDTAGPIEVEEKTIEEQKQTSEDIVPTIEDVAALIDNPLAAKSEEDNMFADANDIIGGFDIPSLPVEEEQTTSETPIEEVVEDNTNADDIVLVAGQDIDEEEPQKNTDFTDIVENPTIEQTGEVLLVPGFKEETQEETTNEEKDDLDMFDFTNLEKEQVFTPETPEEQEEFVIVNDNDDEEDPKPNEHEDNIIEEDLDIENLLFNKKDDSLTDQTVEENTVEEPVQEVTEEPTEEEPPIEEVEEEPLKVEEEEPVIEDEDELEETETVDTEEVDEEYEGPYLEEESEFTIFDLPPLNKKEIKKAPKKPKKVNKTPEDAVKVNEEESDIFVTFDDVEKGKNDQEEIDIGEMYNKLEFKNDKIRFCDNCGAMIVDESVNICPSCGETL